MSEETSTSSVLFPLIYDQELATQNLDDFLQLFNDSYPVDIKNIFEKSDYKNILPSIFSASPYLTRLFFKYPDFSAKLLKNDPDQIIEDVFKTLNENISHSNNLDTVMRELRIAKAHIAMTTAIADLSGKWPLLKITHTLSIFAEISLKIAVNYLIKEAVIKGDLSHTTIENVQNQHDGSVSEKSGYVVLAMGKLGGYELNYSSDIDLIVMFDLDIVKYSGKRSAQDLFVKITQKLVRIMSDRTADGYVFRTDLRLRPDPGATPVALSMEGAEIYYQSVGLNWERAAMIKARPIAGDIEAGHGFFDRIRSFIWRKHLDYAAIDDIHAIKKLIHKHHNHTDIKLEGHDVKLGRGGIREIEFFAQIHQLISGGRELSLRIAPTCDALDAIMQQGHLSENDNNSLQIAYAYFRTLEHRLQMINDDQTHEIPTLPEDVDRITKFMGYENTETFKAELILHLNEVHELFNNLLKDTHQHDEEDDEDDSLSFPNDNYHPDTIKSIEDYGFDNPEKIYDTISNWLLGRYRACRTDRARRILRQLIPDILAAFSKHADPDGGIIKFDDFLSKLPSGVQLFSFIKAQPWLLDLLAQIIGIAPFLSNQLSRQPLLLDSVINTEYFEQNSSYETLQKNLSEQLSQSIDFQDILDITRRWNNESKFQIGLQILKGKEDVTKTSRTLTNIADITLTAMLEEVKKEFALKHGIIKNSAISILAMGKLGGYEFTTTSDVDMVLIYDSEDMDAMSDGPKPLSVNHYYARLSQNFINSITALTGEGKLYEVDMRLRPAGTSGPIAVSLDGFNDYQIGQAWTWEHMALTRSRVMAGPDKLNEKINEYIFDILTHKDREPNNLLFEVAKMRKRLEDNYRTDNIWNLKHMRGGIMDVEFICQYLILKNASSNTNILERNTLKQIEKLTDYQILEKEKGQNLYNACHRLQSIQSFVRFCLGSTSKNDNRSKALLENLAERLKCIPGEIETIICEDQKTILDLYNEIIEIPVSEMIEPEPVPPLNNKK